MFKRLTRTLHAVVSSFGRLCRTMMYDDCTIRFGEQTADPNFISSETFTRPFRVQHARDIVFSLNVSKTRIDKMNITLCTCARTAVDSTSVI